MMRKTLSLLLVLVMSATGFAAGPVLVITDAGYQTMTSGPNGAVLSPLTPIGSVIDMRTGAPVPPGTPPDVTTDPIAAQVKAWAAEVNDPTSAQALALVYREVGKASAGQSREKVQGALRQASDSVLAATGGTAKWAGWRVKVGGLIDAEEAKGPVDYPKFCESVAKGLDTGAALDPALLQLIFNLVMQIIQLFLNNGGGGGV
jgi:hypothetical protein